MTRQTSRDIQRLETLGTPYESHQSADEDFFALNCYSARYICEDTAWRKWQNTAATLRILPYIADVPLQKLKAALASNKTDEGSTGEEVPVGGPAQARGLPATSWITDAGYERLVGQRGDAELTATGWPVAHYGLARLLLDLQRHYAPRGGIVVTEAGAAFDDDRRGAAGRRQAAYLRGQSVALRRAMAEGADVRGYFWWTLMDNFEWSFGASDGARVAEAVKRKERLDQARVSQNEEAEAAALLAMADAQAAQERPTPYRMSNSKLMLTEDGVGDSLEGAESALRLAKEVLRRMEEAGHVEGRAAAKHVMAKACLAGGQAEAVAEAQEALQLFRALGHLEGEAATLDVLAQAQLQEDPQTAFHSASSGREIFRRLGDRRASMLERSALGALLACGQLDEALKEAEASVRRCRRDPGDRREEAAALVMLAEVPEDVESPPEVVFAALAAAEIFAAETSTGAPLRRSAGDRRNQAAALHLAASAHMSSGQAQQSLPLAQRAQEIFRSLRERHREVVARGVVVEAYLALGERAKAVALASEGLEEARQRQDHVSYSEGSRQVAGALLAEDRAAEAQQMARQACNAAGRLRGRKRFQSQAAALEVLVEACRRVGDFEAMTAAAEETCTRLQSELVLGCQELSNPTREARALRLCTRGHLLLRRPKRAIASAGRAMTLFKEQGDDPSAEEMRSLFARAQALRSSMQEAAQEARQAWLLYREHGDARLLFQAAKNCHDAHHKFDDQNVLLLEKL
eukprot:g2851.t2